VRFEVETLCQQGPQHYDRVISYHTVSKTSALVEPVEEFPEVDLTSHVFRAQIYKDRDRALRQGKFLNDHFRHLYGNVFDVIPHEQKLLSLPQFLDDVMFPSYDVVLHYDRSRGVRAARGNQDWADWLQQALGAQSDVMSYLREPGTALDTAVELAQQIVKNAPLALIASKEIVQKAVEEPKDLLLGAALIALGIVLWVITRAIAGPAEPIDPARLVD